MSSRQGVWIKSVRRTTRNNTSMHQSKSAVSAYEQELTPIKALLWISRCRDIEKPQSWSLSGFISHDLLNVSIYWPTDATGNKHMKPEASERYGSELLVHDQFVAIKRVPHQSLDITPGFYNHVNNRLPQNERVRMCSHSQVPLELSLPFNCHFCGMFIREGGLRREKSDDGLPYGWAIFMWGAYKRETFKTSFFHETAETLVTTRKRDWENAGFHTHNHNYHHTQRPTKSHGLSN